MAIKKTPSKKITKVKKSLKSKVLIKTAKAKVSKKHIFLKALANVRGKMAVRVVKRVWCFWIIAVLGLLALGGILMFYFQDSNLWSGRVEFNGPVKVNSVHQQIAPVALANPASEFCLENGGQWKTWNNTVGEKGICYFSEYKQCDEWAMYRGECPLGGADLSAYRDNKQAQYCLISGGKLILENDDCLLPSGITCNLFELDNGICP